MTTPCVSIVIPLATGEMAWHALCDDFEILPKGWEIILVPTLEDDISDQIHQYQKRFPTLIWHLTYCQQGRGKQLNQGANLASHPFVWFLHADSKITQHNIQALLHCMAQQDAAISLFYFNLYFYDKTNWLPFINEFGAKIRSDILGIPFGDQGFFMSKEVFKELGGYDEDASYGEDHLFVWQAKHQNVSLKPCCSRLRTSARKYLEKGWCKLTLKYQYLWQKQMISEWVKQLKIKFQ